MSDQMQYADHLFAQLQDANAEIKKLRTRVSELEEKSFQVGFDYSQAFILREKAEAVDEVNRRITGLCDDPDRVKTIDPNLALLFAATIAGDVSTELRQQAAIAEKAGGER